MYRFDVTAADLAVQAGSRAAVVLTGATAAVMAVERLRRRPLRDSTLLQRVRTWWVIGPLFLLAAAGGVVTTTLLAVAVGLAASVEFGRLAALPASVRMTLAIGAAVAPLVAWLDPDLSGQLAPLFLLSLAGVTLAARLTRGAMATLGVGVLGFVWIVVPLSSLVWISGQADGGFVVLLVGFGVALSDVGAFTVGSTLGRKALSPVSPSKTRAGLAGNVLGAGAATALLSFGIPDAWGIVTVVFVVVAIAAGSVLGDLAESQLKRDAGVKDTGASLPGMGGILDRIDSLLFAVPLTHLVLTIGGVW